MFPTDSEFILLYIIYFLVFVYFFFGLLITKRNMLKINFSIYFIYSTFLLYIFSDENNFKGGTLLLVLFLGGILIVTHLFIYGIIEIVTLFKKKK